MFHENLSALRRLHKLTQEELAERVGVSRQALAKWETGETLPDIGRCRTLAQVLGVSLDDLVNYEAEEQDIPVPPKGKHVFGVVKVGDRGQIVIPQKARRIFAIRPGDRLIVLGDESRGIVLLRETEFLRLVDAVREATE